MLPGTGPAWAVSIGTGVVDTALGSPQPDRVTASQDAANAALRTGKQLRFDISVVLRELVRSIFVVNRLPVKTDQESTVIKRADSEDSEIFFVISDNIGHQPGGHWIVVSRATVLNLYIHPAPFLLVEEAPSGSLYPTIPIR
jgi:hypothetical protein